MVRKIHIEIPLALILACGALRPASAQMAVVDVQAIFQLVAQYETLQRQYEAMTGGRGMEHLLAGTVRNYLPTEWGTLIDALNAAGALSTSVRAFLEANAVLTPDQLAMFSPQDREHLEAMRRSTATLQSLTKQALETTSGRFDAIQQLIDSIPAAGDSKAILDLQARIQAEQGMLTNESNKLQVLFPNATH
jgi:type IV secretion system protein VirB5